MGKMGVAAAATGFTGTGAAGIYGAHHMGVFGGGKSQAKAVVALTGQMEGEKAPFANECLKNIFQDASVESNLPSLEPNFTWKNKNEATKACLVYNWEKKNKEQHYKGSSLHLVWTMSKGDEGVAVHLTATIKSQNEIEFEGYAYVFGKEEDKWKAQKKLGLKDGDGKKMMLKEGDWKTKFPKRGTTNDSSFVRKTDTDNDHYWCFLDTKGEKVQESGSETTRNLWWKWNPSQHGSYQLKNWSSNLGVWWEHFFDKNKMDMAKLMEGDPVGSWG